jgi:hypothetical protein
VIGGGTCVLRAYGYTDEQITVTGGTLDLSASPPPAASLWSTFPLGLKPDTRVETMTHSKLSSYAARTEYKIGTYDGAGTGSSTVFRSRYRGIAIR